MTISSHQSSLPERVLVGDVYAITPPEEHINQGTITFTITAIKKTPFGEKARVIFSTGAEKTIPLCSLEFVQLIKRRKR